MTIDTSLCTYHKNRTCNCPWRATDAEEARRTADATGRDFVAAFTELQQAYGIPNHDDTVIRLCHLLAQLRADEYEAGHATGYAQHPGNRKES